ncbi:MAG: hypothetical protein B6242_02630 [Anaerolineaceae bacterium 4572_78]|nr:MAG: hypothetical protein B6242_02630 [Anaerolineaceae bacterium 4572_78]
MIDSTQNEYHITIHDMPKGERHSERLMIASPSQRPKITCPTDVANLLMFEMRQLEQEHLKVFLLDTKNFVIASPTICIGNVNSSIIRPAEVFREAIRENRTSLIVVHNHPSGDPTPSEEDVHVTQRLIEAGQLLGIDVLDHIVIGQQGYVSLKEKGLGFS